MLQHLRDNTSRILLAVILGIILVMALPSVHAQKSLDTAKNFFDNTITNVNNPDNAININPYEAFYNDYIKPTLDVKGGEFAITKGAFVVADILRYAFTVLAVIFVVLAGVKMLGENEEQSKQQLTTIRDIIAGIIVMNVAGEVVKRVFGPREIPNTISTTDFLSRFWTEDQARAVPYQLSQEVILPMMDFILSFLAAFCIMLILIFSLRIITSQGEEDSREKVKNLVLNNVIGLSVIVLAKVFVNAVYGIPLGDSVVDVPGDISPHLSYGIDALMSIANYMLGFMALGSIIAFVYAGVLIIFGGVNEEQKKKGFATAKYTFYALIVAMSSYAFVSTLIRVMV